MYDNSNIRFKTSMKRSNLCNYSDAYILLKEIITVLNTTAAAAAVNNTNEKLIFENHAPFTDSISEINNTQVNNAEKLI